MQNKTKNFKLRQRFFAVLGMTIFLLVIPAKAGIQWFIQPASALTISKSNSVPNLQRGLVGWWTMDGKDMSGTTAIDKLGLNNLANRTPDVARKVTGKIGQALIFTGANNNEVYKDVGTGMPVNTSSISFSIWIKPQRFGGADFVFYIDGWNLLFRGTSAPSFEWTYPTNLISGGSVPLNKWSHVVGIYDGSYAKLYVNGNYIGSSPSFAASMTDGSKIEIGARGGVGSNFLGSIDDVRIYNRALSASEVQELYKQGGGVISKPPVVTLQTGLVGWWTFDGGDWASALITKDKSGNGNIGTLSGGVTKVKGKIGQGLSVNGSNGYVDGGGSITLPTTAFTYSIWYKPKVVSASTKGILNIGPTDSSAGAGINVDQNDAGAGSAGKIVGWLFGADNNWHGTGVAATTLVVNKWYFITMTYDKQNFKIYVNGVKENSNPVTTNVNYGTSPSLRIGLSKASANEYANGTLDDARIYNRALSASEIMQLYKQGGGIAVNKSNSVPDLKSGLVGWWTFDGKDWASALVTLDKSGSGKNGTLYGGGKRIKGILGQGLNLDGSTGYVLAPGFATSYSGETFAAWVKTGDSTADWKAIAQKGNIIYMSRFTVGKVIAIFDGSSMDNSSANESTTSVNDNKWHLIVGTNNGTLTKIYVDGKQENSYSETLYNSSDDFYFGSNAGTQNFWNGSLDDIRVYNRPLTPTEIQMLYKMGK